MRNCKGYGFPCIPLELDVLQKILTAPDALGEKHIASCCDCDDMGVFAEWLERNRVVDFSRRLP